jgi:hypothetical protein
MKNLIYSLMIAAVMLFSSACTIDKVKNDCLQFDKGFIESCNKSCPPKCVEMASTSKQVQLPADKIKTMCTQSCTKHCLIQLEKIRPTQCRGKK